jgi:cell division protein FtsB
MSKEEQNFGEVYSDHIVDDSLPTVAPRVSSRIRESRDMVFSGMNSSAVSNAAPSEQNPRNRKQAKRRFSPFSIVLLLLTVAIASVLYIGNILAVGRLMAQINLLQTRHQQILHNQELLKAQINRLSGLDRIQQFAKEQIGLQNPKRLPIWIEISPERIQEIEEFIQQRKDQHQ